MAELLRWRARADHSEARLAGGVSDFDQAESRAAAAIGSCEVGRRALSVLAIRRPKSRTLPCRISSMPGGAKVQIVGSWFLVDGSWFLVDGSWFMVLGSNQQL